MAHIFSLNHEDERSFTKIISLTACPVKRFLNVIPDCTPCYTIRPLCKFHTIPLGYTCLKQTSFHTSNKEIILDRSLTHFISDALSRQLAVLKQNRSRNKRTNSLSSFTRQFFFCSLTDQSTKLQKRWDKGSADGFPTTKH